MAFIALCYDSTNRYRAIHWLKLKWHKPFGQRHNITTRSNDRDPFMYWWYDPAQGHNTLPISNIVSVLNQLGK